MNMKQVYVFLLMLSYVSAFSFGDKKTDLKNLGYSNSAFGFDVYKSLKQAEGNIFFSPYSISTAFAMTYAGAKNQTQKEISSVFYFPHKGLHSLFGKLQKTINTMQDEGSIKLSVANALWLQKEYPFLNTFVKLNEKYYGAGIQSVDFLKHTEDARQTINAWIEDKTQDHIKELIKPRMVDKSTRLVLSNAIYFKGNWKASFEKKNTKERFFHLSATEKIQVPMMMQSSKYKFKKLDDFRVIELPYEGNSLSMFLFLPTEVDGLGDFERKFTNKNVNNWIKSLQDSSKIKVKVSLPKFKITSDFELSSTLIALGMPRAFSSMADFSGMDGTKDLYISNVVHKAFVDVNEEGTEATASTAVIMARKSIRSSPVFQANHPFLFLIREQKTGSILFMGRVVNPK